MKAILIVNIPDEVWENREKDLGMYVELWSERIDKDWHCKYFSDSLKPLPERKYRDTRDEIKKAIDYGWNSCLAALEGKDMWDKLSDTLDKAIQTAEKILGE